MRIEQPQFDCNDRQYGLSRRDRYTLSNSPSGYPLRWLGMSKVGPSSPQPHAITAISLQLNEPCRFRGNAHGLPRDRFPIAHYNRGKEKGS